jgi:replicative superfamily II helicase
VARRTIHKLAEATIVTLDDDQFGVTPNPEAHIMTKHLIKFETMVKLMALPATATVGDVLETLSTCSELDKPVRRPEKRCLNEVMMSVRFTEKNARVQTGSQKASALIQAAVHRLPLQDFHLKMEQAEILDQAQRILQALNDLAIKDGKGQLLWSTVVLTRALEARVWETDEPQHSLLMQLPHVDAATAKRLQEHDIRTLKHVANLNVAEFASRSGLPRLAGESV